MDLHTASWCTIRLRFLSLPFLKNFSRIFRDPSKTTFPESNLRIGFELSKYELSSRVNICKTRLNKTITVLSSGLFA